MADKVKFEKLNLTLTNLTLRWTYLQGKGVVQKDNEGNPNGKPNRHQTNAYMAVDSPEFAKLKTATEELANKSFSNAPALLKAKLLKLPYADMDFLASIGRKVHESEFGMIRIRPWTQAKPVGDSQCLGVLDKYQQPFAGEVSLFDAKANLIVTLAPFNDSGTSGITMYLSLVQILENGKSSTAALDLSTLPSFEVPELATLAPSDESLMPF